ncbi:MAG: TOMM system kinase/cyclase fusion protein [Proteobacteria bacterium]|nr:TOMM system kinase/cyclase fusion protein [Pseudomonadota bacterium]
MLDDRYEILGQLGEGGFGVVYKARQRTTGQLVAIKTVRLPPGKEKAGTETWLARFLRETQLCAQLHHPNIVQLINAGEADTGLLYTVFAFVPGKSLSHVLADEGALNPIEAQYLMLQVLDALACAHQVGVVHRDLKPSNIMINPAGARRNALVLDFGIGTIVKGLQPLDYQNLTRTNESLGTPGYAAPEQLRGQEPSLTTDFFSWGLVFLECLTGQRVFRGSSVPEIIHKQLDWAPIPLPVSLQGHPLGELLKNALAKDGMARPKSAGELLKALEACDLRGLSPDMIAGTFPLASAPSIRALSLLTRTVARSDSIDTATATVAKRQVTALCCNFHLRAVASPGRPDDPARAAGNRKPAVAQRIERIADVEAYNRELGELFATCARVAGEHRGYVVATLGQQALLFFGYPTADEHDARRAARAAQALLTSVRDENKKLAPRGLEVAIRLGIHTGLVVIPDHQAATDADLTVGLTSQIAAQVAARAPLDSILATMATQQLLRTSFAFAAEGVLEEPAQPLRLFRLQGEHSEPLLSAASPVISTMPLVGREQEIELLFDRWCQTRQGTGQCSLVTGEPGIGKSRLAHELGRRIMREPHTSLECRCAPEAQNSPLFPIIELIERLLGREDEGEEIGKLARLEAFLVRYGVDVAANMPLFAALLAIPAGTDQPSIEVAPDRQKELTLEALLALILAMAEERPTFLLVEDLHWADPTTIELLTRLVSTTAAAPLCAVFTARPEFSPTTLPTGILRLTLSRLASQQIEAMIADITDGAELPDDVIEQIIKRTEGVPLFVEELTRMLTDSGALVLRGDRYELQYPLSDAEIPATLRALLTSRLDRLGRARETAQLAAALGRELGFKLLSACSDVEEATLREDIDKLLASGLIQKKRKRGDQGYLFKHALIRDAAYESLAKDARRAVHARIARTLEQEFPQLVQARPDLMAQHHASAEQKREAIGYADKAARAALKRTAYAEAAAQVNQALPWIEALAEPEEQRAAELELSALLLPALRPTVGFGAAQLKETATRTLALTDSLGTSPHTFPALSALVIHYHLRSERARSLELARRLVELAVESGDVSQDLTAHAVLSQCLAMAGRYREARTAAERSIALHDPIEHRNLFFVHGIDPKTFAHIMLGWSLAFLGYLDQATIHFDNAVAWARELNLPSMLTMSLFYIAYSYRLRGERKRVLDVTEQAIAVADRYGLRFGKAYAELLRGWAINDVAETSRILGSHKASGQLVGTPFFGSILAEALAAHGRVAEALDRVEELLRFSAEYEDFWFASGVERLKGNFLLLEDPPAVDRAEACYRRAIRIAQRQQARTEELDATAELARLLHRQGRREEAYDTLFAVYSWFTEGFEARVVDSARKLIDELAHSEQVVHKSQ